jgi:uncharacterized protein (DUF924 family)
MSDPVEVLDFWLGEIGPEGWYAGTAAIDEACAQRFGEDWQARMTAGWSIGPKARRARWPI